MGNHKSLRFPDGMQERIEAIAKANGMTFSAAVRWMMGRMINIVEMEMDNQKAPPRRRVLSKGVG